MTLWKMTVDCVRGPGFTFDVFVSFGGLLKRLINFNLLYLSQKKKMMRLEKIQRRSIVIIVALCEI